MIALRLAPTRLAPSAVAQKSIASESRVSSPSRTSTHTGTLVKPSAQAATSMPANTSGNPGSAGSTVPTRPTTIIAMAIR